MILPIVDASVMSTYNGFTPWPSLNVNMTVNFNDASLNGYSFASSGTAPTISTSQYKFSPASGYFSGSGYIKTGSYPISTSADNPMSVSAWVYPTSAASSKFYPIAYQMDSATTPSSGSFQFRLRGNGDGTATLQFIRYTGGSNAPCKYFFGSTIPVNAWSYVSIRWINTTYATYTVGTTTTSASISTGNSPESQVSAGFGIGGLSPAYFSGYIQDVVAFNGDAGFSQTTYQDALFALNPTASFSANVTSSNVPFVVGFTNTSTGNIGLTTYSWTYNKDGAGPVSFSTSANPTKWFNSSGSYVINLTVTNPYGASSTTQTIVGRVDGSSVIGYNSFPSSQINNQTSRTGTVTIGNISGSKSFIVYATYPTQYTVSNLSVNTSTYAGLSLVSSTIGSGYFNATVNSSSTISAASVSPILDFKYFPTTYSDPGTAGVFNFSLSISSHYNTSSGVYSKFYGAAPTTAYFGTWGPITNSFTGTPTVVSKGSPVVFTGSTGGYPNTYLWAFGDGNTSTSLSPSYTYPTSELGGYRDISFTAYMAENATLTNTTTRTNYIYVNKSALAQYDLNIGAIYQVLVYVKDGNSQSLIATSNVTDENGVELSGSGGAFYQDVTVGTHKWTATAPNYLESSVSASITSNTSETIWMYAGNSTLNNYAVTYPPVVVIVNVKTPTGANMPGAIVNVTPYSNSLGSYSYIATLFGYNTAQVPLQNMSQVQSTDSNGYAQFVLMYGTQYGVSIENSAGVTFSNPYMMAVDSASPIWIITGTATGNAIVDNGYAPQANVMFNTQYTRTNTTHEIIWVNMTDSSLGTTGGYVTLFKTNTTLGYAYNTASDNTVYGNLSFSGSSESLGFELVDQTTSMCPHSKSAIYALPTGNLISCWNETLINGQSYQVDGHAETQYGPVTQTGSIVNQLIDTTFAWLSIIGVPLAWFGFLIMLLVGLAIGEQKGIAPIAPFMSNVMGWIWYLIGGFAALDAPVTEMGGMGEMLILLGVSTLGSVVYLFAIRRRNDR